MYFRLLVPLMLALAIFGQAQTQPKPGSGINFCSLDREIAMGAQLADAVRRDNKVLDSNLVQDYVACLGRQLALQVPGPNFPYTFTVVAVVPGNFWGNPTHEPLALPGGPIFIPASLILEAQDTAELAGMLAHAIAHVANRDCTRRKTRGDLMQMSAIDASLSGGCWVGLVPAVPLGYLKFQQAFESQADYLAVQTMAKAGFDPAAFVAYIQRAQQIAKPGAASQMFSPWPRVKERVEAMEKEIRTLTPGRSYSAGEDLQPIQDIVRKLMQPEAPDPTKPTLVRAK
jgi:predicted Zn-dependent protease